MDSADKLFLNIIEELQKQEILDQFIVIGGWCQKIYRYHYQNPAELSALRTADIDLLVRTPGKIKKELDINSIFESLGFDESYSNPEGFIKYIHPDMEIEFLVSGFGRDISKPFILKKLNSNAQRLRYLDIIEKHPVKIEFYDFNVTVPEPAAFVINKLITSERRKSRTKREKDLFTVKELGEYILSDLKQKELLPDIFNNLTPRLRKKLLQNLKDLSNDLFALLSSQNN